MGETWDLIKWLASGALESERSQEILREKNPPVKGLSAETAEAVERGDVEIVEDDKT